MGKGETLMPIKVKPLKQGRPALKNKKLGNPKNMGIYLNVGDKNITLKKPRDPKGTGPISSGFRKPVFKRKKPMSS